MMVKAAFAEHDHVIQALPSDRSNKTFDIRALPWRTWRWQHLFDSHRLHLLYEVMPKDAVAIAEQITGRAVHSAVGCAVTAKCTIRRRSCASTRNTYRT